MNGFRLVYISATKFEGLGICTMVAKVSAETVAN